MTAKELEVLREEKANMDKKAFDAGQQAYKNGTKRAPVYDKNFWRGILSLPDSKAKERKQALKDWARGWDIANIDDEAGY